MIMKIRIKFKTDGGYYDDNLYWVEVKEYLFWNSVAGYRSYVDACKAAEKLSKHPLCTTFKNGEIEGIRN